MVSHVINKPDKARRYLITGANGQLGSEMTRLLGSMAIPKPHEALDVTNLQQIREWLPTLRPTAVIHCASYRPQNDTQLERGKCWQTNVVATDNLVKTCAEAGIPLVYLSSNRVFGQDDGRDQPYCEEDPTGPVGFLAQTKMAAEHAILRAAQDSRKGFKFWILRTANLYERPWRAGHNLAQQLLREYDKRPQMSARLFQTSFTYVPHLAQAVQYVLDRPLDVISGIYHLANSGSGTHLDFAQELAQKTGRRIELVANPKPSDDHPSYTVLDSSRFAQRAGGPILPCWQDAVAEFSHALRKTS